MPSPASERSETARPWRLLTWTLGAQPRAAAALAVTLVLVLACELGIPRLLAEAIDAALVDRDAWRVDMAGIAILALVVALYFVHVGYLRAETVLLYAAMRRLRSVLIERILRQPLDFFARAKTGELTHIVLNDTEVLENHGVYVFSDLPFELLTAVGVTALMFWLDLRMALVVLGFLVVSTAVSFLLGKPIPTLRKTIQKTASQLSARLAEGISGARTVKAFGRTDDEIVRLDRLNAEVASLEIREGVVGAWVEPMLELMELLGVAMIVWYGAHRVLEGGMTPGLLVAFIAYMELLAEPVSRSGRYIRHVQTLRGVFQRLDQFLAGLEPELVHTGTKAPTGPVSIEVRGVSYRYPGADRAALECVSFVVQPGELVVLAGPNGAGKSTLVDLLLRFRSPQSGQIVISAVPLEDWDEAGLRKTVALLPQEVFLFHASLAENIGYGRGGATHEDVMEAAIAAGLRPVIDRLSEGLETVVGDRGQRLSGGERQRVAIARTLIGDPGALILDEPTAALDGIAARDLAQLARSLSASRPVIMIAHRAETVAAADRLIVLDQGRVVADGRRPDIAHRAVVAALFAPEQSPRASSSVRRAKAQYETGVSWGEGN